MRSIQQVLLELAKDVQAKEEQDKARVVALVEFRRMLDLCPGCLPDGTGVMGPEQWIRWAKTKLGYEGAAGCACIESGDCRCAAIDIIANELDRADAAGEGGEDE